MGKLLLEFNAPFIQLAQEFRSAFEFDQRLELDENIAPVQLSGLAGDDAIDCFTRFAPTLQRESADDSETPALVLAERLQFHGGSDNFSHGARLS